MARTLIVPGLNNSGPDHWQSWWQALEPDSVRMAHDDWATPDLARWQTAVEAALDKERAPVWIVAHSFGCLASVAAAVAKPRTVLGAFLVAPADPDKFKAADLLPRDELPFPSVVVASINDPWMKFITSAYWAGCWGSRLMNVGRAGHINPESGFGPWVEGRNLFASFGRAQEDWPSGDIPDLSAGVQQHRCTF